jgi:hypothetical protein
MDKTYEKADRRRAAGLPGHTSHRSHKSHSSHSPKNSSSGACTTSTSHAPVRRHIFPDVLHALGLSLNCHHRAAAQQSRSLQADGAAARAQVPHGRVRGQAQQGKGEGPDRLFGDQAIGMGQGVFVQAQLQGQRRGGAFQQNQCSACARSAARPPADRCVVNFSCGPHSSSATCMRQPVTPRSSRSSAMASGLLRWSVYRAARLPWVRAEKERGEIPCGRAGTGRFRQSCQGSPKRAQAVCSAETLGWKVSSCGAKKRSRLAPMP